MHSYLRNDFSDTRNDLFSNNKDNIIDKKVIFIGVVACLSSHGRCDHVLGGVAVVAVVAASYLKVFGIRCCSSFSESDPLLRWNFFQRILGYVSFSIRCR
jgi:hypothetical protein